MGFSKKQLTFLKIAKDKNLIIGCNWKSKVPQNVKKVVSSRKKFWIFEKRCWVFFEKSPKSSQFDEESNQSSKISRNVQNLRFFLIKHRLVFRKNSWLFQNRWKYQLCTTRPVKM